MVCSTAILSSSLALSLLRNSAPPFMTYVFSPFSINTALSIVHDGASGISQKELTELLLNGCTADDVTGFYSNLARSIPSTNETGVQFLSINGFYVDDSIPLNAEYQRTMQQAYNVNVKNIKLSNKVEAAKHINKFVEEATHGKISFSLNSGKDDKGVLFSAAQFNGKWKIPFHYASNYSLPFEGDNGNKWIPAMNQEAEYRVNLENNIGSLVLVPYQDEAYNFFYLEPRLPATLEAMRNELTGEKLSNLIKSAGSKKLNITVPMLNITSMLNGVDFLQRMGVNRVFNDGAELSKISSAPLKISNIQHHAIIEMDQLPAPPPTPVPGDPTQTPGFVTLKQEPGIQINRPFLFGILRNDVILFLGQFNG